VRRVACIALPQIRIEIAREDPAHAASSAPLAVVIARPGGSVKTARDVLGNTRLDVVSREARALGVRVGQTVAAARAKCTGLHVRVLAESTVGTALSRVAEVALAFGPSAAFDVVRDVVWLEIGGCSHLHGGEHELARILDERVRVSGHVCRVAISDGPRIASAVARLTQPQSKEDRAPLVVSAGQGAAAIRELSVEALDLAGDTVVWLRDLGLRTCGDLQRLPKRSLGTRLGARTKDVMQLLNGEDAAPLDAWRPPEVPEERVELEWGASSVEALGFVVRALCDRLALRLEGRAMAASRIGLVLALDRALLGEGDLPVSAFELALPVPVVRAADLFAVVRTRLEHLDLPAPVLAVTLRALELSSSKSRPLDFFAPEPRAARVLGPLVAELVAELGLTSVGTLALVDTWSPDERTRLAPYLTASELTASELTASRLTASRLTASRLDATRTVATASFPLSIPPATTPAVEPSRLVHPLRRSLDSFEDRWLLARFEAVEWWRRGLQRRDFCAAWDGASLAWIELRATGDGSDVAAPSSSAGNRAGPSRAGAGKASAGGGDNAGHVLLRGWID
jgi:protein ImuB